MSIEVVLIAVCSLTPACERDTRLSIDNGVPPGFSFSGSGLITFFTVEEIAPANQSVPDVEQHAEDNKIIWWIWPNHTVDKPMDRLPPITYGKVPEGWNQKEPMEGAPPSLVEGKVYEAGCVAASANGGTIRFIIRDGKAIEVPIPHR